MTDTLLNVWRVYDMGFSHPQTRTLELVELIPRDSAAGHDLIDHVSRRDIDHKFAASFDRVITHRRRMDGNGDKGRLSPGRHQPAQRRYVVLTPVVGCDQSNDPW